MTNSELEKLSVRQIGHIISVMYADGYQAVTAISGWKAVCEYARERLHSGAVSVDVYRRGSLVLGLPFGSEEDE